MAAWHGRLMIACGLACSVLAGCTHTGSAGQPSRSDPPDASAVRADERIVLASHTSPAAGPLEPVLPPPAHQPGHPPGHSLPMGPDLHQHPHPLPHPHPAPCGKHCPPERNCCAEADVLTHLLARTKGDVSRLAEEKASLASERQQLQERLAELSGRLGRCEQQVGHLREEKHELETRSAAEILALKLEKERVAARLEYINQQWVVLREELRLKEYQLEQCREQGRAQVQQAQSQLQVQGLIKDLLAEKDLKMKEVQLENARQQALMAYSVLAASKPACGPCGPCGPVITDMSKTTVPHGPSPVVPFNTPMATDQGKLPITSPVTTPDQGKAPAMLPVTTPVTTPFAVDQAKAADQSKLPVATPTLATVTPVTTPDQGKTDQAKTDQAKTDQSKTDQAKTDQAKTDQSKPDQAKTVTPTSPNGVGGAAGGGAGGGGGGGAAAGGSGGGNSLLPI